MRWQRGTRSRNIDDRRARRAVGGGLGLGGILAVPRGAFTLRTPRARPPYEYRVAPPREPVWPTTVTRGR